MRKSEVLNLRWSQLDLAAGAVRLEAADTKTEEPRVVYLTERVLAMLAELPRSGEFAFPNPATGRPRQDIQSAVERARDASGLAGVWVHDLRRSFVTQARRSGLPESVVARFSGHRTAAVFKRHNIVEEQDIKVAVAVQNQVRASAPAGRTGSRSPPTGAASQAAPTAGHEMDHVDGECGQKFEGPAS